MARPPPMPTEPQPRASLVESPDTAPMPLLPVLERIAAVLERIAAALEVLALAEARRITGDEAVGQRAVEAVRRMVGL